MDHSGEFPLVAASPYKEWSPMVGYDRGCSLIISFVVKVWGLGSTNQRIAQILVDGWVQGVTSGMVNVII